MLSIAPQVFWGGHGVCGPDWSLSKPRFLNHHLLYFIRSGEAEVKTSHGRQELTAGNIYLIPGLGDVSRTCKHEVVMDWVHFRMPSLHVDAAIANLPRVRQWSGETCERWDHVFVNLESHFANFSHAGLLRIQAMILELLADCLEEGMRRKMPDPVITSRKRVLPAVSYIERHYRDNPQLEEIAEAASLSPTHLHRMFKQAFSMTPHNYVEHLRMREALMLLHAGDMSVTQVAEHLGFGSVHYFSKAFKRRFTYSPMRARRLQKES